jgi:hypothetical protein
VAACPTPALVLALALLATGCSVATLPPCLEQAPAAPAGRTATAPREGLIGVDGSDTMAGLLRGGAGGQAWTQLLQAVKLATADLPDTRFFRVGGASSTPIPALSEAESPCFFGGCATYPAVASALQTLWERPRPGPTPPLRLLITDLEVNQGDISAMRRAMRADIERGASLGVLAVRLPFEGTLFNANAQRIHQGKANRPVYLLASGASASVEKTLTAVRRNLAVAGVPGPVQLSLLGAAAPRPLLAARVWGDPQGSAVSGLPIRLQGTTYGPAGNGDYQLARLLPNATGLRVSSAKGAAALTAAPAGLMTLTPLSVSGVPAALQGLTVHALEVSGRDLVATIRIPPGVPSGVFRGTVAAGTLPEPWWLTWNRDPASPGPAVDQTDNLLVTLTALDQSVVPPGSPPAAAFCVAFTR